jgi:hypothetical protein
VFPASIVLIPGLLASYEVAGGNEQQFTSRWDDGNVGSKAASDQDDFEAFSAILLDRNSPVCFHERIRKGMVMRHNERKNCRRNRISIYEPAVS